MIYVWCYFKDNKCIQVITEINSNPLTPMQVVLLKTNGIKRILCDVPDNFDPTGKSEEELKEYLK
jgi:hypothetical protein